MDADFNLLAVSFDFNLGDTEVVELSLKCFTKVVVLNQCSTKVLFARVPTGILIFRYAYTKTVWINFLSHNLNLPLVFFFLKDEGDVSCSLVVSERSALCSRTNSFKEGACCCIALCNVKLGCIHVMVVLSVCHS